MDIFHTFLYGQHVKQRQVQWLIFTRIVHSFFLHSCCIPTLKMQALQTTCGRTC